MAMDERSRYALHQKLEQLLGTDEAGTLMEHLPPVGWGDLATRSDLKASETYVIGTLRSEIASQTRMIVLTNLGGIVGVAALVLAATKL
jgi:hypothetical protein